MSHEEEKEIKTLTHSGMRRVEGRGGRRGGRALFINTKPYFFAGCRGDQHLYYPHCLCIRWPLWGCEAVTHTESATRRITPTPTRTFCRLQTEQIRCLWTTDVYTSPPTLCICVTAVRCFHFALRHHWGGATRHTDYLLLTKYCRAVCTWLCEYFEYPKRLLRLSLFSTPSIH